MCGSQGWPVVAPSTRKFVDCEFVPLEFTCSEREGLAGTECAFMGGVIPGTVISRF